MRVQNIFKLLYKGSASRENIKVMAYIKGLTRKQVVILLALILSSLASILYFDEVILESQWSFRLNNKISKINPLQRNIIYPSSFHLFASKQDLIDHYNIYFNDTVLQKQSGKGEKEQKEDEMHKFKDTAALPMKLRPDQGVVNIEKSDPQSNWLSAVKDMEFKNHPVKVYESFGKDCKENRKDFNLEITNYKVIDNELEEMALIFQDQLYNDPAFKEFRDFFKDDILEQMRTGTIDKHWFKFAGTSVWLKDMGVHLMISRVIYSIPGDKRKAISSFTYAQVFNSEWEELKNVELILNTRSHLDQPELQKISFPKFLPIPFYNDPKFTNKVYYGPEDPRMLLVKNENGDEEPVIVFNSYHKKVAEKESLSEGDMKVQFEFFRSMFICWPLRFQKGKLSVDGISNPLTDEVVYNKVAELRRENSPRLKVQKNWTPLVNHEDRLEFGHDKYLHFVYRWSKLEILKCSLTSFVDGMSMCLFDYKRELDLSKSEVGPLRGGTEMINIRDIPGASNLPLPDKEIWIGFPRAHIKKCGCGKDMYRPNLAAISKEADGKYKITQLSSFVSLDVEVHGWTNPKILCAERDANVLISNGVSAWSFHNDVDYLTLSLSVADDSNQIIHMKNVLNSLVGHTKILGGDTNEGFDDHAVDCALKESEKFCKIFGKEMKDLGRTPLL